MEQKKDALGRALKGALTAIEARVETAPTV
jgi:hypothetical protein